MSDESSSVAVKIMDCLYKVSCNPEQIAALKASSGYVDAKMRELRDESKMVSIDRIAVITALNIAHELLSQQKQKNLYIDNMHRRIQELGERLDHVVKQAA